MYFENVFRDTIYLTFILDNEDMGTLIVSARTSFDSNSQEKNLSFDCINKYLDVIEYEISTKALRVVFFKKRYYELLNIDEKQSDIKIDIPYVININIFSDYYRKYSKLQFKITHLFFNDLAITPISKDEYFTVIENAGGYEIVEKTNLEKRLKEIKDDNEYFEKLRNGDI